MSTGDVDVAMEIGEKLIVIDEMGGNGWLKVIKYDSIETLATLISKQLPVEKQRSNSTAPNINNNTIPNNNNNNSNNSNNDNIPLAFSMGMIPASFVKRVELFVALWNRTAEGITMSTGEQDISFVRGNV